MTRNGNLYYDFSPTNAVLATVTADNFIVTTHFPFMNKYGGYFVKLYQERSYVVALGSADFLSAEYESSCANRNIMLELLRLMWDNTVYYDNIDYKSFDDNALTVSTAQSNTWTIMCVAVIPVAIGICGLVVYVRRRHS